MTKRPEDMTTPELARALGYRGCAPGCTCRGTYAGPDRRAEPRHSEEGPLLTSRVSEAWRNGRHSRGAGLRERQEAEFQGTLP